MNKIRKTLIVVFSALFVLGAAMFAAGCEFSLNNSKAPVDAETPDAPKNAYTVSVDVNDPSLGCYTLTEANDGGGYEEGTLITFTVKPNENYEASLSINGEEVELQGDSYTLPVTENIRASVNYSYKYVVSTYVLEGEGTIELSTPESEDGKYQPNEDVTVTLTPEEGYALKEVLINGESTGTETSDQGITCSFSITGKTYVVAKFVALHTVTLENNDLGGTKGTVKLTAGEAADEIGEDPLAEGTAVTLTVTPKAGETFKAYVNGAYVVLAEADGAMTYTFTLKADTTVKVVWDTYYTVTVEGIENATVTKYVKNQSVTDEKFLAGTELSFTVEADEGYKVSSVTNGEELTPVNGRYTVTVNADITIKVVVEELSAVETYTVTVMQNNSKQGAVALDKEAEKYAYGTELILTVTPEKGFKIKEVRVDGARVQMTDAGDGKFTYKFTVKADVTIYVTFAKTERYEVRVDFRGLSALVIAPTLTGATAQPGEDYLSASCFEGQEYTFALNLDKTNEFSKGVILYYSVNGANREDWIELPNAGFVLKGTVGKEDITYVLTCELPELTQPTLSVAESSLTEGAEVADYVNVRVDNGKYVYTFLEDPTSELCPKEPIEGATYVFTGWIVRVDGTALTAADSAAMAIAALADEPYLFHRGEEFIIEYSEEREITFEAVWESVGYSFTLTVNNLPDHTIINIATFTYDEAEDKMTHIEDILQITESGKYTVIISSLEYYCQVEMEQTSFKRITFYDPWYDNGEGGHVFYYDGLGSTLGNDWSPDIWTNGEHILTYLTGSDEAGEELTLEVTYSELYRVYLNDYEQSGMLVADGESFTLTEDLVKTSKPTEDVYGEWIYHWYQKGDYSKYYAVGDTIEDVHADLHLMGEWVVPVTLTISFPTPVSKDGTAPEDMFFAVMWRGQKLTTGENQVYWSSSIHSDEPLKFYYNIPNHWMTYISYYVSEDEKMGDASMTMAYYHGNTNNYDYNGDGSAGVPAPTCALDKYSYMKLEFTFTQRHVLSLAGDNLDQVEVNRPDMKDGYYYDGYYHGRVVEVTIKAKEGWTIKNVTADKETLVQHVEGTDVWTVTMTDDITLTIEVEQDASAVSPAAEIFTVKSKEI